jgi:hypothetical protein
VDPTDDDADLRRHMAELGEPALRELRRVLEAPAPYRDAVSRALIARPAAADLAALLALADDPVVRTRLLWALDDLGVL